MSKNKTSYADIWIKAYLAALTRVPPEKAYQEASESLGQIIKFLNTSRDEKYLMVEMKGYADADIRQNCWAIPRDAKTGYFIGEPVYAYLDRTNKESKSVPE